MQVNATAPPRAPVASGSGLLSTAERHRSPDSRPSRHRADQPNDSNVTLGSARTMRHDQCPQLIPTAEVRELGEHGGDGERDVGEGRGHRSMPAPSSSVPAPTGPVYGEAMIVDQRQESAIEGDTVARPVRLFSGERVGARSCLRARRSLRSSSLLFGAGTGVGERAAWRERC